MSFFTKNNLIDLGLNEEQIEKIFSERGKELAKYNDYDEVKRKYKEQGEELTKLQELEPEKLKEQLDLMSKSHKEQLKDMENKHKENVKKMAVKMNLTDVYDPDIVLSLLDLNRVELDDNGNVKLGLEEQFKELKKEKSFLFKSSNAKFEGTTPVEGDTKNNNGQSMDNFLNGALRGAGLQKGE